MFALPVGQDTPFELVDVELEVALLGRAEEGGPVEVGGRGRGPVEVGGRQWEGRVRALGGRWDVGLLGRGGC